MIRVNERRLDLVNALLLVFSIAILVAVLLKLDRMHEEDRRVDYGLLEAASSLAEKGLYEEAAAEYERYLGRAELTDTDRKNVYLALGDLLLRDARDYRKALAAYAKLLALYPDLPVKAEINGKIAECLARLGRAAEADRLVREETKAGTGETALEKKVARIGDTFLNGREFEERVAKLPAPLRVPLADRDAKLRMLHEVLRMEVVEREARALDLRNRKEFSAQVADMEKLMLRQFLIMDKVLSDVKIDEQAVKYFYEARKDLFREPAAYAATVHFAPDATRAVEILRHLASGDGRAAEASSRVERIDPPVPAAELSARLKTGYDLTPHLSAAKEGQAAGPFDLADGSQAVIRIDAVRPGLLKPLEEVRPLVESRLLEEKQQAKLAEYFQRKFSEYGIRVYEEAFE